MPHPGPLGLILLEAFMNYANRWIVVLRNVVASAATLGFVGAHPVIVQADDYDPVIVISMGDHFFEVPGVERNTPIKVKAGRVYFCRSRNDGKQEHNVEWGREVLTKDGMPEVYATHLMGHIPVKITHNLWDVTVDGPET
jgi:hypothetical protein